MNIANKDPDNSGFQPNDDEAKNIYLQESYCSLNNDASTSAEEIFNQILADKKITLPASYIP